MAGLDPAIQAATLCEKAAAAPVRSLDRHNLDGRVKPGYDGGNDSTSTLCSLTKKPAAGISASRLCLSR